jgi:hypothetical protein
MILIRENTLAVFPENFDVVSPRHSVRFAAPGRNSVTAMSNNESAASTGDDLLKNSTLYKEFQAEREEILRHKWIESEKAGYDIGFERALTDWIIKHRAKWRKGRTVTHSSHSHS